MRSFLIHKNLTLYHWLRRRIGRGRASMVAKWVEKIILNIDVFFAISFLVIEGLIAGLILFWFFLVFLNITSF
jgi:hypothetical protein